MTPTTEAGKRLLADVDEAVYRSVKWWAVRLAAIETEARAEVYRGVGRIAELHQEAVDAIIAAERARIVVAVEGLPHSGNCVAFDEVLAIVKGETE